MSRTNVYQVETSPSEYIGVERRPRSKRVFDETIPPFASGIQDTGDVAVVIPARRNKRFKPESSRGKVFRTPFFGDGHHHRSLGGEDHQDLGHGKKTPEQQQQQPLTPHVNDGTHSTHSDNPDPHYDDVERESHLALSQLLIKGPERYKSQGEIAKAPIDLAWHFVENVIDRKDKIQRSPKKSRMITTVAEDELYFVAQRFVACRDSFIEKGIPSNVTIGYHYTRQHCVDGIRQNGLVESSNGTFGRGVYLGNNPLAFHGRGNRGLLVAILRGNTMRVGRENNHNHPDIRNNYNTLVGNKLQRPNSSSASSTIPTFWDEIILQQSSQCIPLISFDAALVDRSGDPSSRGNDILWHYHREMQRVLDLFFNNGEINQVCKSDIFPTPPKGAPMYYPQNSSPRNMSYYVSCTLNGNWQNDKDWHRRKQMIHEIARIFKDDSNGISISKEMFPEFLTMVKTLEVNLYRSAPSFGAYADKNTLKGRLKDLVSQLAIQSRSRGMNLVNANVPCDRIETSIFLENIIYTAPKDLDTFLGDSCNKLVPFKPICDDTDCAICLVNMKPGDEGIVKIGIQGCDHAFHRDCVKRALEMKPCCPICRRAVKEPRGTSPSGTMTITSRPTMFCAGFESTSKGTFVIKYEMYSNFQKQYHLNPGVFYLGTERVTYLPDNEEGAKLLKRLKYAWKRGLSFTVGTSLTTGNENSIIWSSIHQKTSINGGVQRHGFPDESYFFNCNAELDLLGVPHAIDCDN